MTARADHVAEAVKHIDGVHDWQSGEGITDATLIASALVAQAEATLALVEQQRIANRLSVAQIDQLTDMARTMPAPGYPADPAIRIRQYLTTADWALIDVPQDDEVWS